MKIDTDYNIQGYNERLQNNVPVNWSSVTTFLS